MDSMLNLGASGELPTPLLASVERTLSPFAAERERSRLRRSGSAGMRRSRSFNPAPSAGQVRAALG